MRILTYTSLFPNATAPDAAGFIYQRTSHLARRGNLVEVVAPVPYLPKLLSRSARGSFACIPRSEKIGNLQVHHPRYPLLPGISMPFHGLLMFAGSLRLARELHRQQHFDCIDAHYVFPDGLAAVLLGRSLGLPVTVSARGTDIHTFPAFPTIRPQIRWTLRNAAGRIAVSHSLARIMSALEPAVEAGEVIGNGVDGERFFPEDRLAARRKLKLDPNQRIIVSVAALREVKAPDRLVRAAALLKQRVPNCMILFLGTGAELGKLQRMAAELDCSDVCQFVGRVPNEQLRAYYAAADVSCLTSRNEGWPNVVLESLACGTPVVATGVGAIPDILTPACGLIVDPTPDAISDGLQLALNKEWDNTLISVSARHRTWQKVAAQVEASLARWLATESVPASSPARA